VPGDAENSGVGTVGTGGVFVDPGVPTLTTVQAAPPSGSRAKDWSEASACAGAWSTMVKPSGSVSRTASPVALSLKFAWNCPAGETRFRSEAHTSRYPCAAMLPEGNRHFWGRVGSSVR
jgi:hypothetical protein